MKAPGVLFLMSLAVAAANTNQPPSRPGLKIEAKFGEFRLKDNTVYYSNNVVVVDPPAKPGDAPTIIHCQELTATRGTNGRLERIVATTRVMIDQGENHARGDKAVYTSTNEQMVLTGAFDLTDTNAPTRPYVFSSQGRSVADAIIYDRLNNRIGFEGSVATDISAATLKNTGTNSSTSTNKARPPKTQPPANK